MHSIRQLILSGSSKEIGSSTKLFCDNLSRPRAYLSDLVVKHDREIETDVTEPTRGHIPPNVVPMIGLEVHAQLDLSTKLFSQGSNSPNLSSNSRLDYLDISLPGTLPKLNENALRLAMLTSLGLNCTIQDRIHFDRKNYFYTDMPAGYQITQYNKPLAKDGFIEFIVTSYHKSSAAHSQPYDLVKYLFPDDDRTSLRPYTRRSQIKQIQLEQDSAKSLHQTDSGAGSAKYSLVDYNRSGAALMEIVFEPDLTNHHEASSLVRELIHTLKALKTCKCELQSGSLRVDANVSIQQIDGQTIENSPRVELKNLNSLKSLNYGIAYEVHRQANLIKSGQRVIQESRSFDTRSGRSVVLREKETTVDYRYVPEPSIPPLVIQTDLIDEIRSQLPKKSLSDKRNHLIERFNMDLALIVDVLDVTGLYEYFLEIMRGKEEYDANFVADFLVFSILNLKDIDGIQLDVGLEPGSIFVERLKPEKMQTIIDMLSNDQISYMNGYEVIKHIFISNTPKDPLVIVDEFDWHLIIDDEKIESACDSLILGMKGVSKKYRKTGQRRFMKMMLNKLSELYDSRMSIRKAVKVLDKKLRPSNTETNSGEQQVDDPGAK